MQTPRKTRFIIFVVPCSVSGILSNALHTADAPQIFVQQIHHPLLWIKKVSKGTVRPRAGSVKEDFNLRHFCFEAFLFSALASDFGMCVQGNGVVREDAVAMRRIFAFQHQAQMS